MVNRWIRGGLVLALALASQTSPATAKSVDRTKLDGLIAKAEAGDPEADPRGYLANFTAALEAAQRLYPAGHPEIAARRQGVAAGLATQGKVDEAAAIIAEILPQLEKAGPTYRKALADTLNVKAFIANLKGDHAAALSASERGLPIYRELAGGKPNKQLATEIANFASISWEAGRTDNTLALNAEAIAMGRQLDPVPPDVTIWYANRVAYLHTLGRSDDAVAMAREGIALGEAILPKGHPAMSNLYANLGAILIRQARPKTAAPYLRRAFEAVELASGAPNQNSAAMRSMFANALSDSGSYADAVAFLDQAIAVIESQLGPESNRALQAHEVRAIALLHLDRLDEALAEQQKVLATRDRKLPPQHRDRMLARVNLTRIALAKNNLVLAEKTMIEGVALRGAAVPPAHPDLLAERALLLLVQSRAATLASPQLIEQAHDVYARLVANAGINPASPLPANARGAFTYLAEVLQRAGDAAGAFEAQQWSARSSVDAAAAAAAARRAEAARPEIKAELDVRRKLAADRAGVMSGIETQLAAPKSEFDLAAANVRLAALDTAITEADRKLLAQGASFGQFTAVPLADVQRRLGKGELFLNVTGTYDRILVTALTPRGVTQYISAASGAMINGRIAALRAMLDSDGGVETFDRAESSRLYHDLFSPKLAGQLRSTRHLLVSASQSLGALPFAVLVPDAKGKNFLIDRMAITRLPGAPRQDSMGSAAPTSTLFAMGDTVIGGSNGGLAMRGGRIEGLAKLAVLPEARAEMAEIAAAIGATDPRILSGSAATKAALSGAKIEPGSVVAFATHGLVSGEFEGLREPALVLSPSGTDDGLLLASEISRMDIPASWVVLSACNTAAGSGPDAPSLSGLAQAFILAGADNILATHWPVRDDIARALTSGTLRYAAKGSRPAEALRLSILDLRKGKLEGAREPAQWAAFELVAP